VLQQHPPVSILNLNVRVYVLIENYDFVCNSNINVRVHFSIIFHGLTKAMQAIFRVLKLGLSEKKVSP
jgi:hypothetical protein